MRKKLSYVTLSLLISILVLFQLFLSNRLTVKGRKLEEIERNISQLEEENSYLKTRIASLGSLSRLILTAKEKGFIKNPPIINLTGRIPIAAYPQ